MENIKLNLPCVAAFAGTDPTGGSGIQADIKTISATGSYAATIITALVSQNTLGVQSIHPIPPEFVADQIESVFSDLKISAVKLGMLHKRAVIEMVISAIQKYKIKNIVLDPVLMAKDSTPLLLPADLDFFKKNLFSKVHLITPNLIEAEYILSEKISSLMQMEKAAEIIAVKNNTNVLIKGGHFNFHNNQSSDVLYLLSENTIQWFHSTRIHTKNSHGTGCTLSSAIASYLAQKYSIAEAVQRAKIYLTASLTAANNIEIGHGNGPLDHFYFLRNIHTDIILDNKFHEFYFNQRCLR